MVQNDGTKPWIWVRASEPVKVDSNEQEAVKEASALLKEVTEKVEGIGNDDSIPVRSSKKTGAKSKKEVREEVQAEATEKLKKISIKHGYVSGKWLMFAPSNKIDIIWSSIASSLVSGPLSSTSAYLMKVSTSPEHEVPNFQHLICIYMPDIYDKNAVTEVMKILLRNHGINLSGVKSNLYTDIGIDSKHPSGVPSTTWKNTALMKEPEIKALKDAFFAELASNRDAAAATASRATQVEGPAPPVGKAKLQLKKKVADDPFASDDEDDKEEEEKRKRELLAKKNVTTKGKKPIDDSETEEDSDEPMVMEKKAGRAEPKTKGKGKRSSVSDNEAELEHGENRKAKKVKTVESGDEKESKRPKKRGGRA